jgi:type III restriction enzyme
VQAWRDADYPGASGITKRLLQHWRDTEQRDSNRRFFFCQLEAIETLMWLSSLLGATSVAGSKPFLEITMLWTNSASSGERS